MKQYKVYNWVWDMLTISFDTLLLAIFTPFYYFASLFFNCQSCFINNVNTFMKIITTIIRQVEINMVQKESIKLVEEFADCLMKIMKAIRIQPQDSSTEEDTIHQIRQILKQDISERIQPLSVVRPDAAGLSNKARFTFLDIYESIQRL